MDAKLYSSIVWYIEKEGGTIPENISTENQPFIVDGSTFALWIYPFPEPDLNSVVSDWEIYRASVSEIEKTLSHLANLDAEFSREKEDIAILMGRTLTPKEQAIKDEKEAIRASLK